MSENQKRSGSPKVLSETLLERLRSLVNLFLPSSETPSLPILRLGMKPALLHSYVGTCPNQTQRLGRKIDKIVLHYTATKSVGSVCSWFMNPTSERSAHYLVTKEGDVIQFVADNMKAWHCKGFNDESIGIEHISEGEPMTPAQEMASVALIRYLLTSHDIASGAITAHRFLGGATDCPAGLFGARTREALESWKGKHFGSTAALT